MSEDLRSAMDAALTDQAGDTVDTTPVEAPVETPRETQDVPAGDTAPATPAADDEDLRSYLQQRKAERPELAEEIDAIHREMQRAWTPKLQERAEALQRLQQYAGIDPADAQFIRQVNELAAVSPQAAAQLLDQARQQLLGQYGPSPDPQHPTPGTQPGEDWDFATETERRLQQELAQMKTWQQQEMIARTKADMDRQFLELGREVGQDVPLEQRNAAARYCLQNNIPPTQIGLVWKGLYGLQNARRAGRDEAAGVVERKLGMTPGPAATVPPPPAAPPEPKDLREAIMRAMIAD